MTGRDLFREIGEIRDEYITEAEQYQGQKKTIITPMLRRTLAAAACLVVCVGLVFTVQKMGVMQDSATESVREEFALGMQMNMYAESSAAAATVEEQVSMKVEVTESILSDTAENGVTESVADILGIGAGESAKEDGLKMESAKNELVDKESMEENTVVGQENMNENVYIIRNIEVVSGQDVWDAFMDGVKMRQDAQVQIIHYSLLDEATVYNLRFENERYYLRIEQSRDLLNSEKVIEAEYSMLDKFEQKLQDGKKGITYRLREGEEEFTLIYIEE